MKLSVLVAFVAVVLFRSFLLIFAVWLAVAFVVGVIVGRLLARRSREYPSPHFGPRPYLYDQDQEGR